MRMIKTLSMIMLPLAMATTTSAADTVVSHVRHAGPFKMQEPIVLDSINNKQVHYSSQTLINTPLSLKLTDGKPLSDLLALKLDTAKMHLVRFDVNALKCLSNVKLTVKGAKHYKVYADGREQNGALKLQPGYHTISVKFLSDSTGIGLSLSSDELQTIDDGLKRMTMTEVLGTKVISQARLSPSGRWAIIGAQWYDETNQLKSETKLMDIKTGTLRSLDKRVSWMPSSDLYYYTNSEGGKKQLVTVDPATGATKVMVDDLVSDYFSISPTETFAILMQKSDGPRKENGVFEIVHPDDRQPYWRTRYNIARLDFSTGMVQPLTYTYNMVSLSDISPDGRHLLFSVATDSLTQRPTTRSTFYDLDLETMKTRMLVEKDGFIANAIYMDNADRIVFEASPEAFGGIGNRVPEGSTPNMFDHYVYIMDAPSLKVTPVTVDDATCVTGIHYSLADKCVYYTAQNGDSVSLYRLDPTTLRSTMVKQPLEVLGGISIASRGGNIMAYGSSMCVPYEVYNITAPSKSAKPALVYSPNKDMYASIKLGTVKPWRFKTNRGYDVTGFYNLPADFDPQKKYPVIVHYYGGCSPTSRRFNNGSHYPAHYWNALGYIVFTVNPSGASGFGQEWASRHVNTMGEGVAQDIIEATRQFVKDVPQCDADHIGCVSASYGGFMTQYMMTKDNPFACGVSHAGISDHTSYWGEGYWGYSYSETSAANSYPWTRKDLFVDRSPLFNADKIKKPILFTHGTVDTNVPIGESVQMYTALRLLGVPTAFVEVEGENHGIMEPNKRTKWINTILAWFQRYLKNDDSWWNSIYSPKKL